MEFKCQLWPQNLVTHLVRLQGPATLTVLCGESFQGLSLLAPWDQALGVFLELARKQRTVGSTGSLGSSDSSRDCTQESKPF